VNPFWQTILITAIGQALGLLAAMWFFRWRKRKVREEDVPLDLSKLENRIEALEICRKEDREMVKEMSLAVYDVREMFQFIRGKLNGEQWTKLGGHGYWTKERK